MYELTFKRHLESKKSLSMNWIFNKRWLWPAFWKMVGNFHYPDFIFLNLGKDKVKSPFETVLSKLYLRRSLWCILSLNWLYIFQVQLFKNTVVSVSGDYSSILLHQCRRKKKEKFFCSTPFFTNMKHVYRSSRLSQDTTYDIITLRAFLSVGMGCPWAAGCLAG